MPHSSQLLVAAGGTREAVASRRYRPGRRTFGALGGKPFGPPRGSGPCRSLPAWGAAVGNGSKHPKACLLLGARFPNWQRACLHLCRSPHPTKNWVSYASRAGSSQGAPRGAGAMSRCGALMPFQGCCPFPFPPYKMGIPRTAALAV